MLAHCLDGSVTQIGPDAACGWLGNEGGNQMNKVIRKLAHDAT